MGRVINEWTWVPDGAPASVLDAFVEGKTLVLRSDGKPITAPITLRRNQWAESESIVLAGASIVLGARERAYSIDSYVFRDGRSLVSDLTLEEARSGLTRSAPAVTPEREQTLRKWSPSYVSAPRAFLARLASAGGSADHLLGQYSGRRSDIGNRNDIAQPGQIGPLGAIAVLGVAALYFLWDARQDALFVIPGVAAFLLAVYLLAGLLVGYIAFIEEPRAQAVAGSGYPEADANVRVSGLTTDLWGRTSAIREAHGRLKRADYTVAAGPFDIELIPHVAVKPIHLDPSAILETRAGAVFPWHGARPAVLMVADQHPLFLSFDDPDTRDAWLRYFLAL